MCFSLLTWVIPYVDYDKWSASLELHALFLCNAVFKTPTLAQLQGRRGRSAWKACTHVHNVEQEISYDSKVLNKWLVLCWLIWKLFFSWHVKLNSSYMHRLLQSLYHYSAKTPIIIHWKQISSIWQFVLWLLADVTLEIKLQTCKRFVKVGRASCDSKWSSVQIVRMTVITHQLCMLSLLSALFPLKYSSSVFDVNFSYTTCLWDSCNETVLLWFASVDWRTSTYVNILQWYARWTHRTDTVLQRCCL